MVFEDIKRQVETGQYLYSQHADEERIEDDLTFNQIKKALLNGEIIEQYPDTGRGESCLVLGYADDLPIHIVCGQRNVKLVLITVYIPRPPKFINPRTRGNRNV